MQLCDILHEQPTDFAIIKAECNQFLTESDSHCVKRMLPRSYADVHRVKIRQHKRTDIITHVFNEAFNDVHNIRQRSLITYASDLPATDTHEPFYVFPINGYNFMYSSEVKNSSVDYKHIIDVVFEQFSDEDKAASMISDIVKYTYTNHNLVEGIHAEAEIIFYNIPYYYAIRASTYPKYATLLTHITI